MAGAGRDAAASRAGCAADGSFGVRVDASGIGSRAWLWFGGGEPPVGDARG